MKIALLGAECTGKSTLARELAKALDQPSARAIWVPEGLREWCHQHARTPQSHEQHGIAKEQIRRVDSAQPARFLIADTTALMTAVYSDLLFGDHSLYSIALDHQRGFDLTLLMELDLVWVADGVQRDGARSAALVDARLREVLHSQALPFRLVRGSGKSRTQCALDAIASRITPGLPSATGLLNLRVEDRPR